MRINSGLSVRRVNGNQSFGGFAQPNVDADLAFVCFVRARGLGRVTLGFKTKDVTGIFPSPNHTLFQRMAKLASFESGRKTIDGAPHWFG